MPKVRDITYRPWNDLRIIDTMTGESFNFEQITAQVNRGLN